MLVFFCRIVNLDPLGFSMLVRNVLDKKIYYDLDETSNMHVPIRLSQHVKDDETLGPINYFYLDDVESKY